jgi:hypothetical protein
VLFGPTCADEPAGAPCLRPYGAALTVRTASGAVVARVRSSHAGSFAVPLAPGRYVLRASSDSGPSRSAPTPVEVVSHGYARVTVIVDSGIRGVAPRGSAFSCANPTGCTSKPSARVQRGSSTLESFARDYLTNHVCIKAPTAGALETAIRREIRAHLESSWQAAASGICNPTR